MISHEAEYERLRQKPLSASLVKEEEKDQLVMKWFKIDENLDEPIPAFSAQLGGVESNGTLFFLHGLGGRKEDCMELRRVAERFHLSMYSIDARRHGERASSLDGISANEMLHELKMTVVDSRLAIDVAIRNGLAEEGRIILVGSSLGGILGGVLAGVDERISGAVLYVAGGGLAEIMIKSKHPLVTKIVGGIPPFVLTLLKSQLSDIDPLNYVDRISPRPLLIQLGKNDELVPYENGMKLFERAKEPKHLVVHESGHELPRERALSETIEWIRRSFPQHSGF